MSKIGKKPVQVVLATHSAELLEYDRRRLKGVVLEEGSLTAHVTIVADGPPQRIGNPADIRELPVTAGRDPGGDLGEQLGVGAGGGGVVLAARAHR